MSAEPRRAAVYLRVSQDRENRRLGVDRHREDAEALIKARGWTPAVVYEENDISGSGVLRWRHRPALLGEDLTVGPYTTAAGTRLLDARWAIAAAPAGASGGPIGVRRSAREGLSFQGGAERLGQRIVRAGPHAVEGLGDPQLAAESGEVLGDGLGSVVGVEDRPTQRSPVGGAALSAPVTRSVRM